jgi:hypothetical protein
VDISLSPGLFYRRESIVRTAAAMNFVASDALLTLKTVSAASDASLEMTLAAAKNISVQGSVTFLASVSPSRDKPKVIVAVMASLQLTCHLTNSAFSIFSGAGLSVDDNFCSCNESVVVPVATGTRLPSHPAEIAEFGPTNASGCNQYRKKSALKIKLTSYGNNLCPIQSCDCRLSIFSSPRSAPVQESAPLSNPRGKVQDERCVYNQNM